MNWSEVGVGAGSAVERDPVGSAGDCWHYCRSPGRAIHESGVEIYVASTADDADAWQATLVHIARESRAYVVAPCVFQHARRRTRTTSRCAASSTPTSSSAGAGARSSRRTAPTSRARCMGRRSTLYAELDPTALLGARQRFDPVGHYSRPDVLRLLKT